MFKSAERKKSHGFTLVEALIVVAIIGILLAVAIPNVLSYYRSLKLTELDDSARTIFMAAQNRLTAMKSAGANLYALSTVEVNEKPDPGVGAGRFLAVTSAQADSLASLVPGGSIESQLHDNHYVVEIDAKTGAVYAVWYWEKENFDYQSESYGAVKPAKSDRLDAGRMVGYYGGSFVDRPNIGQTPMPSAQVVNAEELKLKISVPGFATGTYAVIKANVTISAGGKTVPIVPDVLGSQGVDLVLDLYNNVFEGEIALDTLDESKYSNTTSAAEWSVGKSFKNWAKDLTTGAYAIAPGANFDIEVKVTAVDTSGSSDPVNYLPQYLYWTDVNSLFAGVEEDSVTGEPVTAKIAYGRHLQNLDTDTSGVTSSITAAEVTRVIDFAQVPGVSGVESWYDTYNKDFTPIVNDKLETFNGGEFEIRNLSVVLNYYSTNHDAGLFEHVKKLDVSDTYLVDAKAWSYNGSAGALVGSVDADGELNICGSRVWVKEPKYSVVPPNISTGNTGNVGGLVGSVGAGASVTIIGSFASTIEGFNGSGGGIGGLVGAVASNGIVTMTNSYAAGYLAGSSVAAGGLVGGVVDRNVTVTVTIKNSYAAGIIAAYSENVAGIANFKLTSIENSYAAVRYGSDLVNFGVNFYGVAPDVATGDNAFYVEQTGVTYKENSGVEKTAGDLKTELSGTAWSTAPGDSHAYALIDETKDLVRRTYPYPMLKDGEENILPHYGDWVEEIAAPSASSLCYYEGYEVAGGGIEYQVWGYIDPAQPLVNNLEKGDPGKGPYAVEDGYCVAVAAGGAKPTVSAGSLGTTAFATNVEINGKKYDLYKINTSGMSATNYYSEITITAADSTTSTYWFNPSFACEVQLVQTGKDIKDVEPMAKPGAGGNGSVNPADEYADKVVIRTARQLANLAEQTGPTDKDNNVQNRFYVQLLDIDFEEYTMDGFKTGKESESTSWEPMALSKGGYNGKEFVISNLYIKKNSDENIGLFGNTKGKLENIRLKNVKVEGKGYVGALAGRFRGDTITNCGVYTDSANYESCVVTGSGDRVGGLIGSLNSEAAATLTNCFAAVRVDGEKGDYVGGLVGYIAATNNDTTLVNCYSGGHTTDGKYELDGDGKANVTGERYVGGLIGGVSGNSYTVKLSGVNYSTCSVKRTGTNDYIGLLAGRDDSRIVIDSTTSTAYATGVAFDSSGTETTPQNETYLTKPTVTTKSGFTTHAYDDTLTGDYPYETNLNEHYGDWVTPKFQVSAFLYWEKEGSVYNYSVTAWQKKKDATDWTGLTIDPTLCNEYDQESIEDYGYGWFYAGDFDGSNPTIAGASGGTPASDAASALESSLKTALETALPGVDLGTVTVEAYSYGSAATIGTTQTWTIRQGSETLQTATLNPDFADTINRNATTPYKVRTIRQLQHINHTAYLDQSFTQEHDLDGNGVTDYVPIGNGTGNFTGHYDGQGYRIMSLSIDINERHANAGLFGKASGEASFEHIIMLGNGKTISASDSSGSLVQDSRARVGGIVAEIPSGAVTISNCVVAGYRLEASATGNIFCTSENVYVGGIVANLNGTVENCEAVVNITNNSGSAYIGGLVGEIGSGSVTNSYAGGSVTTSDTTCVGGLVGKAASDNQITNSFSYVTGAHYAIDGNGRTHNSCAYFGDTFANNRDNDAQQCASVTALTNWLISNATFHYAEYVYDGSGEVSGATFNGAVVEVPGPDGDPVYVHYGDLPA